MEEWSCGTGKKLLIKLFEQSVTRRVRRTTGRNLKEAMRWHIHVEGRSVAKCYAASILEIQHLYGRKFNKQRTGRCHEMPTYPEASRGIQRHQVPFSGPMESHSSDSHYMSTTCHYMSLQYHSHPQSIVPLCRHASLWAFMAGICRRPLLGKSNPAAMLPTERFCRQQVGNIVGNISRLCSGTSHSYAFSDLISIGVSPSRWQPQSEI